jgi:hypothetical protein
MLYVVHDINACLGSRECSEWSSVTKAVVPVLTAAFHSVVSGASPAHFIKQLNRALISVPAGKWQVYCWQGVTYVLKAGDGRGTWQYGTAWKLQVSADKQRDPILDVTMYEA